MDIHTRQLRYFLELAQCLNFTKAAINLYIAQPALSQQIAELEKQLGVTLFVRNSRSVSLTPAGQILLESCPDLLAKLEQVNRRILLAQAGLSGSLKIGYLVAFQQMLPALVRRFRQRYPDIALEFVSGSPKELRGALENGDIDVAFLYQNGCGIPAPNSPASHILWREDLCLAVHEQHPFVLSGCGDYALLAQEPLYLLDDSTSPGFPAVVQDACGKIGLRAKSYVSVSNIGSIMIQIEAGLGISLLPAGKNSFLYAPFPHVRFVPVKKAFVDFGVIWYPDSKNATLPLFLDVLESSVSILPEH